MITIPPSHPGEIARINAVNKLNILDTSPSESFDRMTRTIAEVFKLPIAAISLTDTDRQWFKSRIGVMHDAIPRFKAPCAQVTHESAVLVIHDMSADSYYKDSFLATSGVRFYAGAPLITHDGFCLGALCVLGTAPRDITPSEIDALRDIAAMVVTQIELRHALGRVNPSSGLPNQTQFIEDFKDLGMDGPRGHTRFAALVNLVDPDQLGHVLQSMGPSYLDELVAQAARMLDSTEIQGQLYHVSPAEFIFIAPAGLNETEFSDHLQKWLHQRTASLGARFLTTARIGILPFQVGMIHYADLLRNLYSSVQHALDQDRAVAIFSPVQDAVYQRRFWLINELGIAFDNPAVHGMGELRLVYQPKIDLATGTCTGAEVLLRWTHPEAGEISPEEFIPVIEKTSIIRSVTQWVLEAAMHQLAAWHHVGQLIKLAVNVSAVNLNEKDFCTNLVNGLHRHGLPRSSLTLEITESALMQNPESAHAMLDDLKNAGISLAIDDFGTGYSSLAYLQKLPVEVVKVDQSFVRNINLDDRKLALFTAMMRLSHDLGHRVIAEGVENLDVARILQKVGCDEAQGYFYAKPMSSQAFETWLAEQKG